MGKNKTFEDLLRKNLTVEVRGVKNGTVMLGTWFDEGTIFLDLNSKALYIANRKTAPADTLSTMYRDGDLILVSGDVSDLISDSGIPGTMDTEATITYSKPFSSTSYALAINCIDASGYDVGFQRTEKTENGFKVIPSADCEIEYIAK